MLSGKSKGFILSILCINALLLLVPIYVEAQEQQRIAEEQFAEIYDNPIYSAILGEPKEPKSHLDILLGAIIVFGVSVIALPLLGFLYLLQGIQ